MAEKIIGRHSEKALLENITTLGKRSLSLCMGDAESARLS